MAPCHSLLEVNLLCPQSVFLSFPSRPLRSVLIADWIWSSQHLYVFSKIQRLPSAAQQPDQQITSDEFSKRPSCVCQKSILSRLPRYKYNFDVFLQHFSFSPPVECPNYTVKSSLKQQRLTHFKGPELNNVKLSNFNKVHNVSQELTRFFFPPKSTKVGSR